jgi:hypothetical protein
MSALRKRATEAARALAIGQPEACIHIAAIFGDVVTPHSVFFRNDCPDCLAATLLDFAADEVARLNTSPPRGRGGTMAAKKSVPVIVCTEWRGVFFGYLTGDKSLKSLELKDARMAIYWGTEHGVLQLAETGPTSKSKISAKADILLHGVTSVFDVADAAEKAWLAR